MMIPTPIHEVFCSDAAVLGCQLYVKRDDLIPYAFGGNKVRIAEEFMSDMRARGCDSLIMYGDLRSNLCRVLAFMCRRNGVPSLMVATSENAGDTTSFNEDIVRRLGVEVLECRKDGIPDAIDCAFQTMRDRGFKPYYIYGDRTGSGNEGTAANAYAKAYLEICSQERDFGIEFDLVACPYGTGCTLGGLVCGSLEADDGRRIVGISISSRTPERAGLILEDTVLGWYAKQGKRPPADFRNNLNLQCGYNSGGYGARDPRVDQLIELMLLENSLPLDPTYTGKALRGVLDYLRDAGIRGQKVLFLHTGGTPLFYDYLRSVR